LNITPSTVGNNQDKQRGEAPGFSSLLFYSSIIASLGQALTLAPHSAQASGSMVCCVSPALMASTAHSLTQSPQFVHASVMMNMTNPLLFNENDNKLSSGKQALFLTQLIP
jgi:hypothetical protein